MSRRGRLRDGAGLDGGGAAKATVGSRGDNGSLKMGPLCWAVGLGSGVGAVVWCGSEST